MEAQITNKKATPREPKSIAGRPPKNHEAGDIRVMYWDGDLHAMIAAKLPEFVVGGRVNMKLLASKSGYCDYTMYKAFNADKLSEGIAKALLRLSEAQPRPDGQHLTKEDLVTFLLK